MLKEKYTQENKYGFENLKKRRKAKARLAFLKTMCVVVCVAILFVAFSAILRKTHTGPEILTGKKENILLMGVDGECDLKKRPNCSQNGRSDTLILFNIDTKTNTINAISIPRDSKVYIAGSNDITKINHAFAYGGPILTVNTIEDTFGIKIHHYIAVNYKVLKEIVDAVGGVDIYVEKDMHYRDRAGGLNIHFNQGNTILDGDRAEEFLRFRHDAMGDIGRIGRQQAFITGLMKKLQSPAIIPKIPDLVKVVQANILTDMNLYQLSEMAAYMQGANLSDMQITTLPGAPSQRGSISYWILDPPEVQKIIDRLIYRIEPPEPETSDEIE